MWKFNYFRHRLVPTGVGACVRVCATVRHSFLRAATKKKAGATKAA